MTLEKQKRSRPPRRVRDQSLPDEAVNDQPSSEYRIVSTDACQADDVDSFASLIALAQHLGPEFSSEHPDRMFEQAEV